MRPLGGANGGGGGRRASPLMIKWGCFILLAIALTNSATLKELRWLTHLGAHQEQQQLVLEEPPTTLAPTLLAPTSLAPTTLAPITLAPTSLAPTLAPTSLAPTASPTSPPPTTPPTPAPTTLAPTAPPTPPPTPLSWWWKELGLEEAPYFWQDKPEQHPDSDERTALEALFPCSLTCAVNKNDTTGAMVSRRAQCAREGGVLLSPHNQTTCSPLALAHPAQQACAQNASLCRQMPTFRLRSGRQDLYSLADVAMEIARHKKTNKVRILMLGDSIAKQIFDKARCHLMRSVRVNGGGEMASVPAYASFHTSPPRYSQRARTDKNAVTAGMQHTFYLPRGGGAPAVEVKLMFQTARRVLVDDEELHLAMCSSVDLLVNTWGLHYTDPLLGDYAEEMQSAVRVWERCAREHNTTVFFAGHPMQHFFEGNPDTGQYINGKWGKQCAPMPDAARARGIDRLDGWSQVARNQTAARRMQTTPWSREELAYCPSSDSSSSAAAVDIHWFPWVEVTQDLSHQHPNCHKRGARPDCSHLALMPQLFAPMWDAMFLAVARDGRLRKQQCDKALPPPEFSSLAKYRTTAAVDANATSFYAARLQENLANMHREKGRASYAKMVPAGGLYAKGSVRLTPETHQANQNFTVQYMATHVLTNNAV